jgi:hypothetical protein
MRIDYGPGYRVYYKDTGKEIIILLCGGDKSSRDADIARAKQTAILLLKNSTAKGTNRHEKGKYTTFKHRGNTQI